MQYISSSRWNIGNFHLNNTRFNINGYFLVRRFYIHSLIQKLHVQFVTFCKRFRSADVGCIGTLLALYIIRSLLAFHLVKLKGEWLEIHPQVFL